MWWLYLLEDSLFGPLLGVEGVVIVVVHAGHVGFRRDVSDW